MLPHFRKQIHGMNKQTASLPIIKDDKERTRMVARNSHLMRTFGDELKSMPALWKEYNEKSAAVLCYDKRPKK